MKILGSIARVAGIVFGIAAQIAIAEAAPINFSASASKVTAVQLGTIPRLQSSRVLLEKTRVPAKDWQQIAGRGIPNELLDVAQTGPLEALRPITDAAGSSASPQQAAQAILGLKRKATADIGTSRPKRRLDAGRPIPSASNLRDSTTLNAKHSTKQKKIPPIWNEKMQARWGSFVWSTRDKSELLSHDNEERLRAWNRLRQRKQIALDSGTAERLNRQQGTVGLSTEDLKQLKGADLEHAVKIKNRMKMRVQTMEAAEPNAVSENWETWKTGMQAEEAALALVSQRVEALRSANAGVNAADTHPRNLIGLTYRELELFHSQDELERDVLRARLDSRITKRKKGLRARKDPHGWQKQQNTDLVWRQGLRLRKMYSAELIEAHVPSVLEEVDSMPPDEAAKKIPILLEDRIRKGKATAAPAQNDAPAASTHSQHHLEVARQGSSAPADRHEASLPRTEARPSLPPWLVKAVAASASLPSARAPHLASGSGTNDAAVPQHTARPEAQDLASASGEKQHQQATQTPVLLDLFH